MLFLRVLSKPHTCGTLLPDKRGLQPIGQSSLTRLGWFSRKAIDQYSSLLPPVGVWSVSQYQCGGPSSQNPYASLPAYSPGGMLIAFASPPRHISARTASIHRLLRGLPGYLILFDTHAFVLQRQLGAGMLPSQSEFCVISMHFTATPRIPHTSRPLETASFNGGTGLSPAI